MRALIWVMAPLLIICMLLASRFVSWERLKGEDPVVVEYVNEGTSLLEGINPDYQGAADAFTHAIEKSPKHAVAVIRRGLAYYRLEEYDKAIADYNLAIKLKRYQAEAYFSRGDAYRELEGLSSSHCGLHNIDQGKMGGVCHMEKGGSLFTNR